MIVSMPARVVVFGTHFEEVEVLARDDLQDVHDEQLWASHSKLNALPQSPHIGQTLVAKEAMETLCVETPTYPHGYPQASRDDCHSQWIWIFAASRRMALS